MTTVFGPQAVLIRGGTRETAAVAVPAGVTRLTLTLSRENWPAAGVDIEIMKSFDGGVTWESPGPTHIGPFVPDPPKNTDVLLNPASISVGWNEAVRQATHVKAHTNNPAGNFTSTVTIEAA